jgi:hypothetical protein
MDIFCRQNKYKVKIPCFIISYNRPSCLRELISVLKREPRLDLWVVDNASTYPPLVEYLNGEGLKDFAKIACTKNYGHKVVWDAEISKQLATHNGVQIPYIVTDCDTIPETPDFLDVLLAGLDKYPEINKIGLELRTDDVPEGKLRTDVTQHERGLPREEIGDPLFVKCPVDTTFAIYRAGYHTYSALGAVIDNPIEYNCKAMRTKAPHLARHLSWYLSQEELQTEEIKFYHEHLLQGSTHWSEMLSGREPLQTAQNKPNTPFTF